MKKTIKYGGLVAGVATAAVAMGSTPVFAAEATYKTGVDNGCNYKTSNYDFEALTAAEKAEVLTAEAKAYDAMAACKTDEAADLKTKIDANAAVAELSAKNTDGSTNYSALNSKATALATNYGATTDAALLAKIRALESYADLIEDLDNATATDDDILAYAKAHTASYEGLAEVITDYNKAVAANEIVADALAMVNAQNAADEATQAALEDREAAKELVDATKETAEEKAEDLADAIEDAEKAIADAKKAGADEETIEALNTQLEAAKNGEDHYDLADVVIAANEAARKAAEDAKTANAAVDELKTEYKDVVDRSFDTNASDNATKAALQDKIDEIKEKYGVEKIDEDSFKTLVKKSTYDAAVDAMKDAGAKDEDINFYAVAEEIADNSSKYNALEDGVADIATDYLDAIDASVLSAAIDGAAEIQKAADDAAKVAAAVTAAATKITGVDAAKEAADKANKDYADTAKAAGETPETPSDNKGSEDNNGETTSYTYTALSDSETAYVSGNDLVLHFDAPYANFSYLTIDGVTIDESMYTVEEGSTKITLSSALLDTLKSGEHTVVAYYDNGKTATAKITIASADVKTPNTGAYAAEAGSAVSSVLGTIVAATLAGAVVVLRKRNA